MTRIVVKQKGFYPYDYMNDFEKFKEKWHGKERFHSSLISRKFTDKEHA